jgi:hypothetical protein
VTALGVAAICLVPVLPTGPIGVSSADVPSFFASTAVKAVPAGSTVVVAPFPHGCPFVPAAAANPCPAASPMLWQVETNMHFRMPGGYFVEADNEGRPIYGAVPTPLSSAMNAIYAGASPPIMDPRTRAVMLADLRGWNPAAILVGPMSNRQAMIAFFTSLLGRPPAYTGGVDLWIQAARDR